MLCKVVNPSRGSERAPAPRTGEASRRRLPPDLAKAVALGGEMGRLFAEFDWAAHPLGRPQEWSAEVRSAVAVVLTSRFPIVLWLGADDLFLVYNDAYIQILGDKHPAALGRRGRFVWWDIWEPISPMLASVIATGRGDLVERLDAADGDRRPTPGTLFHLHLQPTGRAGRRDLRDFLPVVGDHRAGDQRAAPASAQCGGLGDDGNPHCRRRGERSCCGVCRPARRTVRRGVRQ